jgi:AcrR family transcriptional regulator
MSDQPVRRRYHAPARRAGARATRDRICHAAEELFVLDGYARTSIRAIAGQAGVSEATVYLTFPDKAALLDAAIRRAIGQSTGENLAEILAAPPAALLTHLAESHAALMQRAARLIALGEGAARMDAELRPLRERAHDGLRAAMRAIADRLDEARLLRAGLTPQAAADALYAIANETTYLRLTHGCGQSPERYAGWLTATLEATLLYPQRTTGAQPA